MGGYNKVQDYFWTAAFVAVGCLGAVVAVRVRGWVRARPRMLPSVRFPLWPSWLLLSAAVVLLFSTRWRSSILTILCALAGTATPWFSRRWYGAPKPPSAPKASGGALTLSPWLWAAGSLVIAAVWLVDPCLGSRDIDQMHEGMHLLYVQSYLAGDLARHAVRTAYGPLYAWSIVWWMKIFGFHVVSLRWYFYAAQVIGVAIGLMAVRAVCASRVAALIGVWLMLTVTTASYSLSPYGWANAVRLALPLGAVVTGWRGMSLGRPALVSLSGVLAALGALYSPEFGCVGILACATLWIAWPSPRGLAGKLRATWPWAASMVATGTAAWIAMFGLGAYAGVPSLPDIGYLVSRLAGHGVTPLPEFRWWIDEGAIHMNADALKRVLSVWGPMLLCCVAAPLFLVRERWSATMNGPGVAALGVFCLLVQWPAVVRPLGQQIMSAPGWILLAVTAIDGLGGSKLRRRIINVSLVIAAVAYGWQAPFAGFRSAWTRWRCVPSPADVRMPVDSRYGGVRLSAHSARFLEEVVPVIRKTCPPGGRILIAAPYYLGLCFLADRAGLTPFPENDLAVRPHERQIVIESLERERPRLALVEALYTDIPYPTAQPEVWAYINSHYRLERQIRDLLFYVRRP